MYKLQAFEDSTLQDTHPSERGSNLLERRHCQQNGILMAPTYL